MALPLFTRAAGDDGTFVLMAGAGGGRTRERTASTRRAITGAAVDRMPTRQPGPGEQYRFHVDMSACIGCKCCVVACNEQNGNPADIQWRRVAEIEGGRFPAVRRAWVSMGCNHCADPTCLEGCPVDAYAKDAATGIVRHSADTCIGCQYCTWTCSYGVPQFNPERGVVGKCDMCYGRLGAGQAPACVSACPEGAITIGIVDLADWRRQVAEARPGDGRPIDDGSVSTTETSLPVLPLETMRPVDDDRFEPAEPHWPLVVMTVLTQCAAGLTAAAWLSHAVAGGPGVAAGMALAALIVLAVGLTGSTLHLGRPVHAYRAVKMWRRSWLSREVVLFGVFATTLVLFAGLLWTDAAWAGPAGFGATLAGLAGVLASARIYQVPSRPLWLGPQTFAQFVMTGVVLGPMAASVVAFAAGGETGSWRAAAAAAVMLQFVCLAGCSHALAIARTRERRAARELLETTLRGVVAARIALLAAGGLLAGASGHPALLALAFVLAAAGELVGRYLFFVAAVPRHMTAPYLSVRREAA